MLSEATPAFHPNRGQLSLASLQVKRVHVRPVGEGIRADFVDMADAVWKMVPVEDLAIRRHQTSCGECAKDGIEEKLAAELTGGDAVLRIGLGRAYRPDESHHGCYLQVNHVFPIPSRGEHFVLS